MEKNKKLYESIMMDIAKVVKKAVDEAVDANEQKPDKKYSVEFAEPELAALNKAIKALKDVEKDEKLKSAVAAIKTAYRKMISK